MFLNDRGINNERLCQEFQKKKVLIAAHRGKSGGNILGNTIPGFQTALLHGADILEFDVVKSTDGFFYIYHDGTEPFHLRVHENIKTMPSERIDSLRYFNAANYYSEFGVERLENVLEVFKDKVLMNIDRAWDIFPELIQKLDQFNIKDQVLIKSPVIKDVLDFLNETGSGYMYMPIIKEYDEIDGVLQYDHLNLVGMELVTSDEESRLFDDETISRIRNLGLFAWVNAVTFNETNVLFAGLDDNTSIIKGPEYGWGKLVNKGFNIILTDWPGLLNKYRSEKLGI